MSDIVEELDTEALAKDALSSLSRVRVIKKRPTPEQLDALSAVAPFIASDATIKAVEADVKSLTDELADVRAHGDYLVTYRNRAIRTAQSAGFSVTAITSLAPSIATCPKNCRPKHGARSSPCSLLQAFW